MGLTLLPGSYLKGGNYTYKIERVLGQGSFGITYLATTQIKISGPLGEFESTVQVAIKEFFMSDINGRKDSTVTYSSGGELYENYKKKFSLEAIKMSKLVHPNIIKVLESFESNNTYYYAMEFCEGGSLDTLITNKGCLSEKESYIFITQISEALIFMHNNNMLHLDLKPGNIMLNDSGNCVLIDFGLSKQYNENGEPESSTSIGGGTPGYAPIEQIQYREGKEFPITMDVYALGATMYKMLTGKRPPVASVLLNEGFPKEELVAKNISDETIIAIKKAMSPIKRERCKTIGEFMKLLSIKEKDNNTIISNINNNGNYTTDEDEKTINRSSSNHQSCNTNNYSQHTNEGHTLNNQNNNTKPPTVNITQTEPEKSENNRNYIYWIITIILIIALFIIWVKNRQKDELHIASEITSEITNESEINAYKERDTIILPSEAIDESKVDIIIEEKTVKDNTTEVKSSKNENYQNLEEINSIISGIHNGYEYVDLGLSVKWATCNVGTKYPERYGNYYAWGEISTKSTYTTDNSKTYARNIEDFSGNQDYDVASAIWQGEWRTPTKDEFNELCNKCTWKLITYKGVNGYKVTSNINGNSIFLPAAGNKVGGSLADAKEYGYYMSSTPDETSMRSAKYLFFDNKCHNIYKGQRHYALSVRPVIGKNKYQIKKAEDNNQVLEVVEQMPTFPGGQKALLQYISENIKYPSIAQENGIQGRVVVRFIVKKDGSVGEVQILRGVNASLDNEAIRVVKSLPNFIPGKQNGHPVNVWYTLPISFKLM